MRFGISIAVRSFGLAAALLFLVNAVVGIVSLRQLRVNGPLYEEIASGKDLIGDILPPPEYVIEAFLETTLAKTDPSSAMKRQAAIGKLRKDFDERRKYWAESNLPDNLKADLEMAAEAAAPFWSAVETEFLPAMVQGDTKQAQAAYAKAEAAYAVHRVAIDHLVEDTNAFNTSLEQTAAARNWLVSVVLYTTSAIGLLVILLGSAAIVRWVVNPLTRMTDAMRRLARGELGTDVPFRTRHDEVGAMATSLQTFKDASIAKLAMEKEALTRRRHDEEEAARTLAARAEVQRQQQLVVATLADGLERLSKGDFAGRLTQSFSEDYEKLRADFNATAASLQDAIGTIREATDGIGLGSDQIAHASDDLSRRTEQQAASLEETAAALNVITDTVKTMAADANEAATIVVATRKAAESSGAIVQQAVDAMGKIKASSSQITSIIGVIDEIAFQTNLLALNAGVEAARAGEAGRGFAVVASEVRGLAQRSAEAAKEIKALISASSDQVETGVVLVDQTGSALLEIVGKVAEMDALVRQISASSKEQATGLAEINTAVGQMDQVVQQNAAMVEESTAAAHALKSETEGLTEMIGRFRVGGEPARQRQPPRRQPSLRPVSEGRPVSRAATKSAPAAQPNWDEF